MLNLAHCLTHATGIGSMAGLSLRKFPHRFMLRYLAFGSNLCSARLRARIGDLSTHGVTEIPGWTLTFNKRSQDGSGKCTLMPSHDALAYGVVYQINNEARRTLDRIEGVGAGYSGVSLWTEKFGEVYTYLAEEHALTNELRPYDWYLDLVIAGAVEHGLPAAYINKLRAVASTRDHDTARVAANLEVLAN